MVNMKNKLKKALSLLIAVFLIVPVMNIAISAASAYLTVNYSSSDADFETAFGSNDTGVYVLTITGNGQITKADCDFIKTLPNIISLNLTDATFKDNKIPDGAFQNCAGLQSIAIPMSVTAIGDSAFANCYSLLNVSISPYVQTIGANAFSNCYVLDSVALPQYLTSISENAFANCAGLKTVVAFNSNGAAYNAVSSAFAGVPSNCVFIIPSDAAGYDSSVFSNFRKVEWNFHKVPSNIYAAAGIDLELSVDVSDKNNSSVQYQWYSKGTLISNATGDTLVINNASEGYSGRYMVDITINNVTITLSCIVTIAGQTTGITTFSTKNTAVPVKTPNINFTVIDSTGAIIDKFDVQDNISNINNGIYSYNIKTGVYTCLINAKTMSDLCKQYNNGVFRFNFTAGGYLDVPFSYANGLKSDYLTGDYNLAVKMDTSQQFLYFIAFTVYDKSGNSVGSAYLNGKFPDNVYLSVPVKDDSYRFITSSPAFPIPQVKSGGVIKIKLPRSAVTYWIAQRNASFSDISNHWAKTDILNAANSFIVNGYTDGTYQPDGTLTRAEFCAMLTRVLSNIYNAPAPKTAKTYSDVKSSDWFYNDIQTGDTMGLNGYATGLDYNPNKAVTREEMAYMIARAAEYAGIDTSKFITPALNYSDLNSINPVYTNDVRTCTNLGLLQGSNGMFMPAKTLTRAEAATVLNRLMVLLAQGIK
ncbi:MAG: S-layer homology domain-containing protein [Oscillospiraceae bacterium]|nr:S-layer homology domain-containing protein [Oscillospiraceae bacterium]